MSVRYLRPKGIRSVLLIGIVIALLSACVLKPASATFQPTQEPIIVVTETALQHSGNVTATHSPAPVISTEEQHLETEGCRLGIGLRMETTSVLNEFKEVGGFVSTANTKLSAEYFNDLDGWFRVIAAPSLDSLRQKAERARLDGTAYEALGYGLETNKSTPEAEWTGLIDATKAAREIADHYGKKLIMAPGFRLMSQNPDKYSLMAELSDGWIIQTQRLQQYPPGEEYRAEVQIVIDHLKAGNPDILIWAQISLLPDREPDAYEWLDYHDSIISLVDGTFMGVYIWDTVDQETIREVLEDAFTDICAFK